MDLVIYKNIDGSCVILVPTVQALEIMTIEDIAEKDVPDDLDWRIIVSENVPESRAFRNAWEYTEQGSITVDMPKARVIHMDKIRIARDDKFPELDLAFTRALEDDNTTQKDAISTQKQTLRDLPQNTDLSTATTPEELEAIWPSELE